MKRVSKKGAVLALAALLTLTCASQVFAEGGNVTTPGSVTTYPDAVTSSPDAVTSSPDAVTTPGAVTSNPDVITIGAGTVETVTDKYVTRYVAADGAVTVQYSDKNNSGTVLKAGDGVLPNGAEFKQSVAKSGTAYDTAAAAVSAMLPNTTNFFVYQFDITANGVDIHALSNYVKVTLSRPADLVIGEGQQLVVYRLEDNGTLTRCESAVNANSISFLTNHFSTYIFSVENVNGTATTTDAAAKAANSAVKSPKTGE